MTGRHRAPHDSWRTPLAAAAATVGLFGTGGILASAYADTIDVPASDSIGTPPTLTETAEAVRGPRGPLALPTIGPPNRWDPSKGEVLPTSAYVPPPAPEPTTEPVATTTAAPVTTAPAPTTTAAPTTTTATTTVAPTTTVPAPTETTATTTATPTDTTLPTPTLPTVSEEETP